MAKLNAEVLAASKLCHEGLPAWVAAKLEDYRVYLEAEAKAGALSADRFLNALDHGDGKGDDDLAQDALKSLSGRANFHPLVVAGVALFNRPTVITPTFQPPAEDAAVPDAPPPPAPPSAPTPPKGGWLKSKKPLGL